MKQRHFLTSSHLKWLALVTMAVDHTGVAIGRQYGRDLYWVLRSVGRVAFPIFAFLLLEGFYHTRSRWKYLRNLLIFAVISEIPFDLLTRAGDRNIFCTLSLGLLAMMGAEWVFQEGQRLSPVLRPAVVLCALVPPAALAWVGEEAQVDYGQWGVLLTAALYFARKVPAAFDRSSLRTRNIAGALAVLAWMGCYDLAHGWFNELRGFLVVVPLLLYNGERGGGRLPKWFFYAFYPAHLCILVLIRDLIL